MLDPLQRHPIQSGSMVFQVIKLMQCSAHPPAICVQITDAPDQISSPQISVIFNICVHKFNKQKMVSEEPGLQELC